MERSCSMTETNIEEVATLDASENHQKKEVIRLICEQGKELFVTRPLLVQSSGYFAALLSEGSNWLETSSRTIKLDKWQRSDLATILKSLKTKETEPIFANVNHYFTAINYFSFHPLMEQCIEFKIDNITDESIIDDLEFAELHSVVALRDKCMEYLLGRLPEIIQKSRKSRRRMSLDLLVELLRNDNLAVRNEDEVLKIIDTWCSCGKRKLERRPKLLQHVRFAHLSESAFEKCREDAQCLKVMKFRRLLETTSWSELNGDFLSGRKTTRVHYHTVGILKAFFEAKGQTFIERDGYDGFLVHCSETGTLSKTNGAFTDACLTASHDSSYIVFGAGIYVFQRPKQPTFLSTGESVESFSSFHHYSDYRDPKPSSTVQFREFFYVVAPPTTFENYLYIARMPFRNKPILGNGHNVLNLEPCDHLEIIRYSGDKPEVKSFRLNLERLSRPAICQCLQPGTNSLFVNDDWIILCLPHQDILVILGTRLPVNATIQFPKECWNNEDVYVSSSRISSDVAIVGNVAYVVLNREEFTACGITESGSITAYDLIEGKWLPGHFVDLSDFLAEKKTIIHPRRKEGLQLSLKVVQKEVFLIAISNRVKTTSPGFPLVTVNYVYRLERSADKLWLSPVPDGAPVNRRRKTDGWPNFTWTGCVLNIDAQPCEYTSVLQHRASKENDLIAREKLRRFIW